MCDGCKRCPIVQPSNATPRGRDPKVSASLAATTTILSMVAGLTPSEQWVTKLCETAFLRLWTHPNPIGKKDKELCDCLVVCGPHVIIVSVKEIDFKDTGDKTGWERWHKSAVDKSVQQIRGAERWLKTSDTMQTKSGRTITLPPHANRHYHRISVSLGGRGEVPVLWGDFGTGFVHVFDEHSLDVVFTELDTITDFVSYLEACEGLVRAGVQPIFNGGGVEDLLAMYVRNGEGFGLPKEALNSESLIVVGGSMWESLVNSREYKERSADLQSSYAWDRLIDHYASDLVSGGMLDMHSKEVTTDELALVAMVLQPRSYRAALADAFLTFLESKSEKTASRAAVGDRATAFVFLAGDSANRENRTRELALRCLVVRGKCPGVTTVVGIATDRPRGTPGGYSSDIAYIHFDALSEEQISKIDAIQDELGYFKNVPWWRSSEA